MTAAVEQAEAERAQRMGSQFAKNATGALKDKYRKQSDQNAAETAYQLSRAEALKVGRFRLTVYADRLGGSNGDLGRLDLNDNRRSPHV